MCLVCSYWVVSPRGSPSGSVPQTFPETAYSVVSSSPASERKVQFYHLAKKTKQNRSCVCFTVGQDPESHGEPCPRVQEDGITTSCYVVGQRHNFSFSWICSCGDDKRLCECMKNMTVTTFRRKHDTLERIQFSDDNTNSIIGEESGKVCRKEFPGLLDSTCSVKKGPELALCSQWLTTVTGTSGANICCYAIFWKRNHSHHAQSCGRCCSWLLLSFAYKQEC